MDHLRPDRRRHLHHLRRSRAPLRRQQCGDTLHLGERARPAPAQSRSRLALSHAHRDQSVLGAGTRHLHVRVDGEIRRRAGCAHRHPCGRRRLRQAALAGGAQAGDPVCAAVRRPVHRHHRHAGRPLCLRARPRPGVAGARMAELDDLSVHSARLLSHVLPLPAGDVAVLSGPAASRIRATASSTRRRRDRARLREPAQ